MRNKTHYLFDLDGTLTDSQEGIVKCFAYAMKQMGLPAPELSELLWCVGPPLRESFAKILGPELEHRVEEAAMAYRERFSDVGLYENLVYQGIPETLQALKARGLSLYVCTSKPRVYAERILEHFGLADLFVHIYGSEIDGTRSKKRELIAHILEQEKLDPERCVMVGDRDFDIIGAKANRLVAIGAAWGYGSREEQIASGADHICDSPMDLLKL